MRVGDWFLYEYHIVLRVYGFEDDPYNFLSSSPQIEFSTEYVRQKLILELCWLQCYKIVSVLLVFVLPMSYERERSQSYLSFKANA